MTLEKLIEDNPYYQQDRSFSLHTAPMPAAWNDGSFPASYCDASATPSAGSPMHVSSNSTEGGTSSDLSDA